MTEKHRAKCLGIPLRMALAVLVFCFLIEGISAAEGSKLPVKIRVFDEVTRVPISGAEILVRVGTYKPMEKLGITTNGFVQFAPPNDDRLLEVRIEANGYRSQSTLVPAENSGATEIQLLPNAFSIKGRVVEPADRPASNVRVVITRRNQPVTLFGHDDQFRRNGDRLQLSDVHATTDFDGTFSLIAEPGTEAVVAVHELGCASAPLAGWTNGTAIRLRPWTTLRGRMVVNGKPAANRGVVAVTCNFFNSTARMHLQGSEATTDAEGKFTFDHLPAGVIEIAQKVEMAGGMCAYSHWASFVTDASLPPTDVVYNLAGRDLSGALVSETAGPIDLRGLTVVASLLGKGGDRMDEFSPLAGGAGQSAIKIFALSVNGDGEFSANAIPPGEYVLHVSCLERFRASRQITGKIIVPPGDGPVAMGKVAVTNAIW